MEHSLHLYVLLLFGSENMPKYKAVVIAETKFILVLNSIFLSSEYTDIVKEANNRLELITFYKSELVEPYSELYQDFSSGIRGGTKKSYLKSFRKGGPLEIYKPVLPEELNNQTYNGGCGIFESDPVIIEILSKKLIQ